MFVMQYLIQNGLTFELGSLSQSMMIEPHHSFVTVKAEAVIRVGPMTGPAETANGETMLEALEVLGHGLGLTMPIQM